jgi:hypothetical protein
VLSSGAGYVVGKRAMQEYILYTKEKSGVSDNDGGGSRASPPETSSYIDVFKRCFLSRHLWNWLMSSHLIFFNTTFYKHFKGLFQEPHPL